MARRTRERGQPKVLVIDDEPDLLELLELTLSRMGLDTTRAQSVGEAIQLVVRQLAGNSVLGHVDLPDRSPFLWRREIEEEGVPSARLRKAA